MPLDRTVESNLVVLCGCLPTFRVFIRHVRPESKYGKGSTAASGSGGSGSNPRPEKGFSLRTFGQGARRTRRQLDTMASIDAMGDGMDLNDSTGDYRATVDTHTVPGSSSRSGSEEAIIQTRTIVQTSKFVPPEQDMASGLLASGGQPARPVDLTDV